MDEQLAAHIDRRQALLEDIRRILVVDLRVPFEHDAIDPDVPLFGDGLGLDSIDAMQLAVAAEARFGIQFPRDNLRGALRTVNTVVDLVIRLQDDR